MPDVSTIRLATLDDVPAILEISNWAAMSTAANFAVEPERLDAWQDDFRQTAERFPWFVAVNDTDGAIAFAKATPWKGRCAYAWSAEVTVYVHPDHHRRGIGRALYSRLIATLQAQGYRTLLAGITLPNPASVALHESFGFKQVAAFEQVGFKFGVWHTVGYWEAFLGDDDSPQDIRAVRDVALLV